MVTLFLKALPMNTGTNFRNMVALRTASYSERGKKINNKTLFKLNHFFFFLGEKEEILLAEREGYYKEHGEQEIPNIKGRNKQKNIKRAMLSKPIIIFQTTHKGKGECNTTTA